MSKLIKFNNKIMSLNKLICLVLVFGLCSCSNNKKVTTTDNSAVYTNSVSLPPLKKPTTEVAVESIIDAPEHVLSLDMQLVEVGGKHLQLHINGDADEAWDYLALNLKRVGITVFTRNKIASRIAVGCDEIDSKSISKNSRNWKVFAKKKTETEYYSLQLSPNKNGTRVSLLNQAGHEVDQSTARKIFDRLLK